MSARFMIDYNIGTDVWGFGYSPDSPYGLTEGVYELPGLPPDGDWVLLATAFHLDPNSAAGLLVLADGHEYQLLNTWDESFLIEDPALTVTFRPERTTLRIDYRDGELAMYVGTDPEWDHVAQIAVDVVTDTGLILRYADESVRAAAMLEAARLLPGHWEDYDTLTEVEMAPTPPPIEARVSVVQAATTSNEPMVYALVGAPYGDMEFDIGKSCRWLEYFSDQMFVLDVNLGDPRYWIVNWALTFPNSEHAVTSINFFSRPVEFRKEQFNRAQQFYEMDDEAWVLFIDGTEGLSFDNSTLPNDYASMPFMSWIYREITRAETASQVSVVIPFFVFLRSAEIQNVTYDHPMNNVLDVNGDPLTPSVLQPVSVPYYLVANGLKRLIKVSRLRDPTFNWADIDTLATPAANVKCQVISYAYAHWNLQDIPPGQTDVPALSAVNDDGFRMRQQISKVRPVPGLQYAAWDDGSSDPAGVPGPWAMYTVTNTNPDFVPITDTPPTAPAPATDGIDTPLYDTVFRLNMRDGVWYEGGVSGNTPLVWNPDDQKWMTPYDPDKWPSSGVDSPDNPDYVDPPTPVP
jgi:hypothetical protein